MLKKIVLANFFFLSSTLIQAKTIWIDVRSPEEFVQGHVAGAVNIPVDEILQRISQTAIDKTDIILLYCRSGNRSAIAQNILLKAGYRNAQNIGGFADLVATDAIKTE